MRTAFLHNLHSLNSVDRYKLNLEVIHFYFYPLVVSCGSRLLNYHEYSRTYECLHTDFDASFIIVREELSKLIRENKYAEGCLLLKLFNEIQTCSKRLSVFDLKYNSRMRNLLASFSAEVPMNRNIIDN